MKRKLLGLLFSFCMAAALLPGTAFAAEESRLKNGETIDLEGMKRNVGED